MHSSTHTAKSRGLLDYPPEIRQPQEKEQTRKELGKVTGTAARQISRKYKNVTVKAMLVMYVCHTYCVTHVVYTVLGSPAPPHSTFRVHPCANTSTAQKALPFMQMHGQRATNLSKGAGLSRDKLCYQPSLTRVCTGCSTQPPCQRLSTWESLGHPQSPPHQTATKGTGREVWVLCHTVRAMPEKINIQTTLESTTKPLLCSDM